MHLFHHFGNKKKMDVHIFKNRNMAQSSLFTLINQFIFYGSSDQGWVLLYKNKTTLSFKVEIVPPCNLDFFYGASLATVKLNGEFSPRNKKIQQICGHLQFWAKLFFGSCYMIQCCSLFKP